MPPYTFLFEYQKQSILSFLSYLCICISFKTFFFLHIIRFKNFWQKKIQCCFSLNQRGYQKDRRFEKKGIRGVEHRCFHIPNIVVVLYSFITHFPIAIHCISCQWLYIVTFIQLTLTQFRFSFWEPRKK